MFAEKLGISPQSISKWERGVGYPDIALFPVLADLLEVPISVIFGEEKAMEIQRSENEYNGTFEICQHIKLYLGNICRVELIEEQGKTCRVRAAGDPIFIRLFDVEQDGDTLCVDVRNPCGPTTRWESYDRGGYTGENLIQIYAPADENDLCFETLTYAGLTTESGTSEQGNYQVTAVESTVEL